MIVKKIKNFEPKVPKKSAFTIQTSEDLPKMNTLAVLSGKRGGGKSVCITTLVSKLLEEKVIDRVIMITPTYWSNREVFAPLNLNEEEDIIEPSMESIKEFLKKGEEDQEEYKKFLEKKKRYKEYKKLIKSDTPISHIDPMLLMEYDNDGFFNGPPQWKYAVERPPRIFLICDDILGTPVLSNPKAGLLNLCIKHRHIFNGVGISIAILTQTYSTNNGLPRAIRENCTLLILFKNNDQNQLEKIHNEIGNDITVEQFDKLFEYATSKPHGFLVIDSNPKKPEYRYRSGWNEYLIPPKLENAS